MPVLIFSTTFVWNISHCKKKWARYGHKCISVFMYSAGYPCQISMKLELSRQIFEKILKYQIPLKSVQWEPTCSIRTDGRIDMTKLTVAFWKYANAPKNETHISCPALQGSNNWTLIPCRNFYLFGLFSYLTKELLDPVRPVWLLTLSSEPTDRVTRLWLPWRLTPLRTR